MKHICIFLIRLYQKYLSPLKRYPTCRFTPTCSAYAIEAFTKRGFFVGFALTVWRILRCNPFCAGGYDPVPEAKPRRIKHSEDNASETYDEQNIQGESSGGDVNDADTEQNRNA